MKFKINRDQFLFAINQIITVVGNGSQLPVLNNVLIETGDGFLSLTTTNIDLRNSCKVKAEVMEQGAITLPAKLLKDMVDGFQDEIFFNQVNPTRVELSSGSSRFLINGLDAADFPLPPQLREDLICYEFDKSLVASMLNSVSYAQSTDENRYVLNGVYFQIKENQLSLVATDGKRLAVCNKTFETPFEQLTKFILPAKTVSELQKQLNGEGKIKIALSERQVVFQIDANESEKTGIIDKIVFISKLVDGTYPKYEPVIPKDSPNSIEIDRIEMLSAISQAKKVIEDKNKSINLGFYENVLEVTASSSSGEASIKLDIRYSGEETKISFNPDYLIDLFKVLPQNKLIFEFRDKHSPGLVKTKEDDFVCVIMPQRS